MSIPFVTIQLDKPRKLRFGLKAIQIAKDISGINLLSINEQDVMNLDGLQLSKLLYAGLEWEDKEITPEKITEIVDEHCENLMYVLLTTFKAINAGSGTESRKDKDEKNAQSNPTNLST